jgi:tetratricopeptide (TPR) repeat protein
LKSTPHRLRIWSLGIALLASAALACASDVHTNPLNRDPLVREASDHFYNLDYPGAVERFERFHAAHPGDPQATALLLDAVLFQELYRLDLLDTTFYANDGFLTGRHAVVEDPKTRDRILALADEAIHEADWRLSRNQNDVDALYARGWARSLKCTYIAMVERGYISGFKLALAAKNDHIRVLQLDPDYIDAKLVVGVYEYVVGALPLPFKLLIGFAGMTGSKSRGLEMLTDDGNRGFATSVEARTTLALFLRREARYAEAIKVVQSLRKQYPRDYLFSLEEANLRKDAGEGMAAVSAYRDILAQKGPATTSPPAWNLPTSASATPCAVSATSLKPPRPMSRPPDPQRWRGAQDPFAPRRRRVPRPQRRTPARRPRLPDGY